MKLPVLCLFFLGVMAAGAAEPVFTDPFTAAAAVPERRAMRGDWVIADGVARCTQDDELYKRNQDHGPILFYAIPTTDATIRFSFKAAACQSLVFTLNGEKGHLFRFVTGEKGTGFRAFPPGDPKSIQTGIEPRWKLPENEWTAVEVAVKGETVVVKFGEQAPVTVTYPTYAAAKVNVSIGFAFGALEVRGFEVTK